MLTLQPEGAFTQGPANITPIMIPFDDARGVHRLTRCLADRLTSAIGFRGTAVILADLSEGPVNNLLPAVVDALQREHIHVLVLATMPAPLDPARYAAAARVREAVFTAADDAVIYDEPSRGSASARFLQDATRFILAADRDGTQSARAFLSLILSNGPFHAVRRRHAPAPHARRHVIGSGIGSHAITRTCAALPIAGAHVAYAREHGEQDATGADRSYRIRSDGCHPHGCGPSLRKMEAGASAFGRNYGDEHGPLETVIVTARLDNAYACGSVRALLPDLRRRAKRVILVAVLPRENTHPAWTAEALEASAVAAHATLVLDEGPLVAALPSADAESLAGPIAYVAAELVACVADAPAWFVDSHLAGTRRVTVATSLAAPGEGTATSTPRCALIATAATEPRVADALGDIAGDSTGPMVPSHSRWSAWVEGSLVFEFGEMESARAAPRPQP